MSKVRNKLVIYEKQKDFLFDNDGLFNVFNLLRLTVNKFDVETLLIDARGLSSDFQASLLASFYDYLLIFKTLTNNETNEIVLAISEVDNFSTNRILEQSNGQLSEETIQFNLSELQVNQSRIDDQHTIKNVRGATLLSIVHDLITIGTVQKSISLFDINTPLKLHSAISFLRNHENSLYMWEVLKQWEIHQKSFRADLNKRLTNIALFPNQLKKACRLLIESQTSESDVNYLIAHLQDKEVLPINVFEQRKKIKLWLIDDQHANGWGRLFSSLLPTEVPNDYFDVITFANLSDLKSTMQLLDYDFTTRPDLAFVDLRLSEEDNVVESYNGAHLTGFAVIDVLKQVLPGLPVMIISASNKLWNVEKAIAKGAVAYWRKSDEISTELANQSILTAFDIYEQFTEKTHKALLMSSYSKVFLLSSHLNHLAKTNPNLDSFFIANLHNFVQDTPRTVLSMIWQNLDQKRVNNNLLLAVIGLFNAIEDSLWDSATGNLLLLPRVKARFVDEKKEKFVINDTLSKLSETLEVKGKSLDGFYTSIKHIRNNMPMIHGDKRATKYANIENIEMGLILLICIVDALSKV